MLEVAVHRDDCIAARKIEPGRERDLMAESSRETDDLEPRIAPVLLHSEPIRPVRAPVVDEDDLPVAPEALQGRRELLGELGQDLLLVAQGNDDGNERRAFAHRETRLAAPPDGSFLSRAVSARELSSNRSGARAARPRMGASTMRSL